MNSVIIPLAIGFLLGNDKTRMQIFNGVQQMAGMGVDALNNIDKGGGAYVEQSGTDEPD